MDLKQQVADKSYEINPQRVAAAIIARLAIGEKRSTRAWTPGGPSRRANAHGRPHRAV
jgi:hypothetical protein